MEAFVNISTITSNQKKLSNCIVASAIRIKNLDIISIIKTVKVTYRSFFIIHLLNSRIDQFLFIKQPYTTNQKNNLQRGQKKRGRKQQKHD